MDSDLKGILPQLVREILPRGSAAEAAEATSQAPTALLDPASATLLGPAAKAGASMVATAARSLM